MDSNKDDALRCIEVAEKYIREKNKEKAEKFLYKAERLFPTQRAKDLLLQVSLMPDSAETVEQQPRKRKEAPAENASPKKPEYTSEQLALVKRIRSCKDYYEILCISKDATDSEVKKAYKKIALQLHPDKNKAPGADEAFKAVGNAVSVLTDTEKRKQYDLYGNEEPPRGQTYNYNRGFEAEVNPEELFNMFFGTGFGGSNIYVRRGGRWQRQTAGSQREHRHREEQQQGGMSAFVQLLPIIIAILLSMASSFFISDPAYSLSVSTKYPIMRRTHNLQVPYYVKENFHSEYQGSVKRLELSVEEEYMSNLRHQCYREKSYRDSMIWKARNFGDQELYNNAQKIKMPSCEALKNLQNHGTY